MENIKKQTLAKQASNEIFVRDNFGRTSMGLRVETKLGDLIAYPSTDPDNPGISVKFRQKGKDTEIYLTFVTISQNDPTDDDINIFCYEDLVWDDHCMDCNDWTKHFTINNQDVSEALKNED